jgi:hypothetical protein
MLRIYIAGITFDKSTKRSNVIKQINSISDSLSSINMQIFLRVVSYQNESALIEFNFQNHDRIRARNGRKILSNFFVSGKKRIPYMLKLFLVSIFGKDRNKSRRGEKYSWRQLNLTGKHVFLWQDFLESDSDFLLVLEDDVVGDFESFSRLAEILQGISAIDNHPLFINLIHEFDLRSRTIETDIPNLPNYFYATRVFANTTGAYILNRRMASYLFEAILTSPNLRVVGADWLIGLLGMKFADSTKSLCLNVFPGIFYNESLSTNTSSLEN